MSGSGEEESSWSIDQWQCGLGITEVCVDKDLLWDEPSSWRTLVDEIIPMTEILIIVGVQYISSQIGPGTTKAINSLRCMINNFGSNTWAFGAGTWQLLLFAGLDGSFRGYMATGYQYVCTCLYDANGIKEMLGLTPESNAEFSSCSEEAANNTVRANNRKADQEQAKRDAAKQSVFDAARNKVINDTVEEMEDLNSCSLLTDPPAGPNDIECMTALNVMRQENEFLVKYYSNKVTASGGPESTKNKDEQTKLENALWVELGILKGLHKIYPSRYNEDGEALATCYDVTASGNAYGEACEAILSTYAESGTPTPYFTGDAINLEENVYCLEGNVEGNLRLTGTSSCDLVPMLNGYSQWQDSNQITCQNPINYEIFYGIEKCVQIAGVWQERALFTPTDQQRFRTLGSIVPDEISEEDISCLADDFVTVRTGSANCWAFWVQNQSIGNIDQYVWVSNESITCGDGLQGLENCQQANKFDCQPSQVVRLNLNSSQICVPTFVWEVKEEV